MKKLLVTLLIGVSALGIVGCRQTEITKETLQYKLDKANELVKKDIDSIGVDGAELEYTGKEKETAAWKFYEDIKKKGIENIEKDDYQVVNDCLEEMINLGNNDDKTKIDFEENSKEENTTNSKPVNNNSIAQQSKEFYNNVSIDLINVMKVVDKSMNILPHDPEKYFGEMMIGAEAMQTITDNVNGGYTKVQNLIGQGKLQMNDEFLTKYTQFVNNLTRLNARYQAVTSGDQMQGLQSDARALHELKDEILNIKPESIIMSMNS